MFDLYDTILNIVSDRKQNRPFAAMYCWIFKKTHLFRSDCLQRSFQNDNLFIVTENDRFDIGVKQEQKCELTGERTPSKSQSGMQNMTFSPANVI